MRKLLAVPIVLVLLMSNGHTADAFDQVSDDEYSETAIGGDLYAQVAPFMPAAGDPPATALRPNVPCVEDLQSHVHFVAGTSKPEDKKPAGKAPSTIDGLRVEYEKLKKAWVAYRDKNDGNKNSHDMSALILAVLALFLFGGDKGLGYLRRRADE